MIHTTRESSETATRHEYAAEWTCSDGMCACGCGRRLDPGETRDGAFSPSMLLPALLGAIFAKAREPKPSREPIRVHAPSEN